MKDNVLNSIIAIASVIFTGVMSELSSQEFTIFQAIILFWIAMSALSLQDINRRKSV